ncbi:hypothetical protein ARMGADRAFT_42223 [Armillaria gallica]|uniref:Uncharacterized protein n=1 Tax=Armillaria gallica TaxID=47427 RepID=A0A2H3EUN0_ARMGA|nr:hypothetical protein ARMGADRAFT_42223 [Armillaria gallica]
MSDWPLDLACSSRLLDPKIPLELADGTRILTCQGPLNYSKELPHNSSAHQECSATLIATHRL